MERIGDRGGWLGKQVLLGSDQQCTLLSPAETKQRDGRIEGKSLLPSLRDGMGKCGQELNVEREGGEGEREACVCAFGRRFFCYSILFFLTSSLSLAGVAWFLKYIPFAIRKKN